MTTDGLDFRSSVLRFYAHTELDLVLVGLRELAEITCHPEDLLLCLRERLTKCECGARKLLILMGDFERLSIRILLQDLTEVERRDWIHDSRMASSVAFAIWAERNPSLYDDFELLRADPSREILKALLE